MRFIHQARQADDLRRTYESSRDKCDVWIQDQLIALEKQIHQTDEALVTAQREDLLAVLAILFETIREREVFPIEALVEWIPLLEARRYRWSEQHTLDEAEQFFQEWSCCLDDPWTYIEKYPEGSLVGIARHSIAESKRQWDEEKRITLARAISRFIVLGSPIIATVFLVLLLTLFSFIKLL